MKVDASKDKRSNHNRGKKNMETGVSNYTSDAADIYYGTGVRITRAMKAEMEAKSPHKNVSGKGKAKLGVKKINSVDDKLSVRTSPRLKLIAAKQNVQHKKQKPAAASDKQRNSMISKQNEARKEKELKRSRLTTQDKNDKTPKQDKVLKNEPSARQMRVMRSLGLVAPLGSPFQKK